MKNVLLTAHPIGPTTRDYVHGLGGNWVVYKYGLYVDVLKDMEAAVLDCIAVIHREIDLEDVGRLLFVPPGYSNAVLPFYLALKAISGTTPELLLLMRGSGGMHIPCPESPLFNSNQLISKSRQLRSSGLAK
jgi:hypothetical protein